MQKDSGWDLGKHLVKAQACTPLEMLPVLVRCYSRATVCPTFSLFSNI